jgi:hypothetical protein
VPFVGLEVLRSSGFLFSFFWAGLVVPMYTSYVLKGILRFVLIKVLLLIKITDIWVFLLFLLD